MCLFIPCAQGVGVHLLLSVAFDVGFMLLAEFCPAVATVLDGLGTMGTGGNAISTAYRYSVVTLCLTYWV